VVEPKITIGLDLSNLYLNKFGHIALG